MFPTCIPTANPYFIEYYSATIIASVQTATIHETVLEMCHCSRVSKEHLLGISTHRNIEGHYNQFVRFQLALIKIAYHEV